MSVSLQPAQVASILSSQFPQLEPLRVTYLGEGWDSIAFDVNGAWVFRFPKRSEVEQQLLLERAVLPLLQHSPVPLPHFVFEGEPSSLFRYQFAGYRKLAGVPADQLDVATVPVAHVARALGRFLTFLHSFRSDSAVYRNLPTYSGAQLIAEFQADALEHLPRIGAVGSAAARYAWSTYLNAGLSDAAVDSVVPVLVHRDLAAEHILLDPDTCDLTGIIDWSEVALSDPAIDFAGVFHWGGAELTHAVLAEYGSDTDRGLLKRAQFLAACRGVVDISYGIETDRPEYVAGGVRALTLCTILAENFE